jgi:DHA1 family bicyclomycin/chloramphenicol resistance-like MFS transporter
VLTIGSLIAATGGLAGLALGLGTTLSLVPMLFAVAVMAMGHGFTLPQSMAASVAPFPHLAATASALFGFMNFGFNGVVVMLNGMLYDGTVVPMLAIIAGLTAAGALLYASFRPRNI